MLAKIKNVRNLDEEFEIDSDVSDFDLNTESIDNEVYTGGVEDYEYFETGLHLLPLDFKVKGSGLDSIEVKAQSIEPPKSKLIHLTLDILEK